MFARSFQLLMIAVPFALVSTSALSDELRVRQLENEVSRLQRELDAQSRRIDELERVTRTSSLPRAPARTSERSDSSPGWLVGTNWDRLRPGMKEVDVIALLGRPTSIRTNSDGMIRSLLYALELGPTAVLAGNVQLSDAGVTQINRPTLR